MKKRKLGHSDIAVSPLTFGTMSLGTDKHEAIQMIHKAIDAGINHIDTADLYDFGENEKIVGEAIKQKRNEVILTTKVGNHFDKRNKTWYWDPSKDYLETAVENSLKRLQTDYIDLYLLHGGTMEDDMDETIETFEKLKKVGKIRAYGISSIRPNVIHKYVKKSNIDAVMMQYSILDRRPESIFPLLEKNNISVLARGPLGKGIMSNASIHQLQTKGSNGFLHYKKEELETFISNLIQLNEPLAKLALQFVLYQSAVASAVFGASTMNQLDENIKYINVPKMSHELHDFINEITAASTYTDHLIE